MIGLINFFFIINNKNMFEYTHAVKDSKGGDWGIFKNAAIADLMRETLAQRWKTGIKFFVEEIV